MITVKLPDKSENETDTVIIGIAGPDIEKLVLDEGPLHINLEHLGMKIDLVIIARPRDVDCIHVVEEAFSGKANIMFVDKATGQEIKVKHNPNCSNHHHHIPNKRRKRRK